MLYQDVMDRLSTVSILDYTDAVGRSMHPSLLLPTCSACLESEKLSADDLRSVVSSIRVISSLESLRWRLSVLRISHSSVCLSDMFLIVMLSAAFSLMRNSLSRLRVCSLTWRISSSSSSQTCGGTDEGTGRISREGFFWLGINLIDRSSKSRNIRAR